MKTEIILSKKTMSSLDIAEVTGKEHFHVMEAIRAMEPAWEKVNQSKFRLVEYKDKKGEMRPCYELTKTECLYIATKFNDEARARLVLRWEELETSLKSISTEADTINAKIIAAEWLSGFLNLNETSRLALAKSIAEPLGLPTPDYVQSKGIVKSATALLKQHGRTISARVFNLAAIDAGYLKEVERKSSRSTMKKFKSITEKGLEFGENQVSPENPKETQPMWYEEKFERLMQLIGI